MSTWQESSDESLIAYVEGHRDFAAAPAMEMQRRLIVAIRDFNCSIDKTGEDDDPVDLGHCRPDGRHRNYCWSATLGDAERRGMMERPDK